MIAMVDFSKKKIPVLTTGFKYKTVFSLSRMYEQMKEWMEENGYLDAHGGTDYLETKYIHEVSGPVKNIYFTLEGSQGRPNSFYKRVLVVSGDCIAIQDSEIVQEGHKFKAQKGEITVKIKATLVYDPEGKWDKASSLVKMFNKIAFQRWIKGQVEQEFLDYSREVYDFADYLKKFVELKTLESMPNYHPSLRG